LGKLFSVDTHVPLFNNQYNLVLAKGWWCLVARKAIVSLAVHWPRIMNSVVYPPTGSMATEREISTLPTLQRGTARFTFILILI